MRNNPAVSTHIYLAFEKVCALTRSQRHSFDTAATMSMSRPLLT